MTSWNHWLSGNGHMPVIQSKFDARIWDKAVDDLKDVNDHIAIPSSL